MDELKGGLEWVESDRFTAREDQLVLLPIRVEGLPLLEGDRFSALEGQGALALECPATVLAGRLSAVDDWVERTVQGGQGRDVATRCLIVCLHISQGVRSFAAMPKTMAGEARPHPGRIGTKRT